MKFNIEKFNGAQLSPKLRRVLRALYIKLHEDQKQYGRGLYKDEPQLQSVQRNMRWFMSPQRDLYFAEVNNKPIGMAAASWKTKDFADTGYVGSLYVQPQYRGTGIGGKLMAEIQRDAKAKKLKNLLIYYYAQNKAKSLYQRRGYKPFQLTSLKSLEKD